jgi:hypothetical protein
MTTAVATGVITAADDMFMSGSTQLMKSEISKKWVKHHTKNLPGGTCRQSLIHDMLNHSLKLEEKGVVQKRRRVVSFHSVIPDLTIRPFTLQKLRMTDLPLRIIMYSKQWSFQTIQRCYTKSGVSSQILVKTAPKYDLLHPKQLIW